MRYAASVAIRDDTLELELIVVDDCSTDASLRVARAIAGEHSADARDASPEEPG